MQFYIPMKVMFRRGCNSFCPWFVSSNRVSKVCRRIFQVKFILKGGIERTFEDA